MSSADSVASSAKRSTGLEIKTGDIVRSASDVTILNHIAGGISGEVWRGRKSDTDTIVAVKIITEPRRGASKVAMLVSQLVKDFAPEAVPLLCLAEECGNLDGYDCMIYPLYAMDMRKMLGMVDLFPLPPDQSQSMIWQLLSAVHYLHELGITHSDIKPENILLANGETVEILRLQNNGTFEKKIILKNPQIKLADLDDARLPRQKAFHPAGTAGYRSPEVLAESEWTNKVDIFAVGCTAFEILSWRHLFPEQKETEQEISVTGQVISVAVDVSLRWLCINETHALSMLKAATSANYRKRPSAISLLRHKYFGELVNIYED